MQFAFTNEQQLIRDTARRFFEERADSAALRRAIGGASGYDANTWRTLSQEMGWSGIALAPEHGGSGLGWVEVALLQFEQGRRLFPSPFFSTVCLGAPLIEAAAGAAQAHPLLERIAAGELRVATGLTGPEGLAGFEGVGATLERADGAWRLSGACDFVVHGADAELLLIVARAPGSRSAAGLSLIALPAARAGLECRPRHTLDATRPMASLRLERIAVTAADILGEPENAARPIAAGLAKARIALAAEAAGGAEAILERTVGYAKERVQFGRPIGSFQAVKHRLADMMVQVEAAKSAAWYAACVADEMPQELEEAAAIAKSACADAFTACASDAIQLHGGIGFTWEHDAQLYFKRARSTATLLGTPAWQRESLAVGLGLGPAASPAF
jgi:alkylation response protein AidB-like acyl-CoA dehydrogenase